MLARAIYAMNFVYDDDDDDDDDDIESEDDDACHKATCACKKHW